MTIRELYELCEQTGAADERIRVMVYNDDDTTFCDVYVDECDIAIYDDEVLLQL